MHDTDAYMQILSIPLATYTPSFSQKCNVSYLVPWTTRYRQPPAYGLRTEWL